MKHKKENILNQAAEEMGNMLRGGMGERILGPDKPLVARVQTWFIKKIMIKIEPQASMIKVRKYLLFVQSQLLLDDRFRGLQVYYDVDPQ